MADSAKNIIEGASLPCVRAGRADNLAAVLAEIRPGNLRTASAELTRWLVDTAKEWSPDWWEGAPVDAITGYFEDREVAELDAEHFRISLVVLSELLQAIGTAGAPAGWWEEIAAAGDDFDAPGGSDYARSMLRIAAEQGTRLARERDLWRGLAGRQRDAFDRLTRSLVEQTSRASELAGQLLQATAERGPLEAERRALRHLAGFFGVAEEEDPAREIARAHTEALRELAQVSAERDRALARLGDVLTCDPSPPRCDVCGGMLTRGCRHRGSGPGSPERSPCAEEARSTRRNPGTRRAAACRPIRRSGHTRDTGM